MNLRIVLAVASLLSAVPASALPIVGIGDPLDHLALNGGSQITFDDVDPRGDHGDLTLGDVRFTSVPDFSITNMLNGAFNMRGINHLSNLDDHQPGKFRFDFLTGTKAFGFNMGGTDQIWFIEGFDAAGAMIDSHVISPLRDSNAGEYFGLMSNVEFHFATLTLLTDQTTDYVMVDNFTVAAAPSISPVPIPASLPLLAAAAGVFGLVKRKRR